MLRQIIKKHAAHIRNSNTVHFTEPAFNTRVVFLLCSVGIQTLRSSSSKLSTHFFLRIMVLQAGGPTRTQQRDIATPPFLSDKEFVYYATPVGSIPSLPERAAKPTPEP